MELNIVIQRSKLLLFWVFHPPLLGVYGGLGGFLIFLFCFSLFFKFFEAYCCKTCPSFCFAGDWFKTDLCIQMLAQIRLTILVTVVVNVTHFV